MHTQYVDLQVPITFAKALSLIEAKQLEMVQSDMKIIPFFFFFLILVVHYYAHILYIRLSSRRTDNGALLIYSIDFYIPTI